LEAITARSEVGRRLDDLYPRYRVPLTFEQLDLDRLGELDLVVVGYPHGAAAQTVAALRERDVRVVDLSADFRLRDLDTYARWYGEHGAPSLLPEAVFGLTELYRDRLKEASLVANPGCYATAAILALAPLARAGIIESAIVDGKSGVSGAGREASETTHFVSVDENVRPYSVAGHRHSAEVDQELQASGFAGVATFVTHLLPLDQGLLASCYVTPTAPVTNEQIAGVFEQAYGAEQFVELVERPPGVRDVRDTNICAINTALAPDGRVLVFAAIDNLWKGAAGQAVQNMNAMLALDEGAGLL